MSEASDGVGNFPSLIEIMPNIGVDNQLINLQGMTQEGIFSVIFPNFESLLSWFQGASGYKFGTIWTMPKLPTFKGFFDAEIASPIPLPPIPGIIGRGR